MSCEFNTLKGETDSVFYKSIHAEIDAIMKISDHINKRKIKLVVVRDGLKLSKPCENCIRAIRGLGIHKIYYSDNGKIQRFI